MWSCSLISSVCLHSYGGGGGGGYGGGGYDRGGYDDRGYVTLNKCSMMGFRCWYARRSDFVVRSLRFTVVTEAAVEGKNPSN